MPPQFLGRRPHGFEGNQRRARKQPAEVLQEIQQHVFAEIEQLVQHEEDRSRIDGRQPGLLDLGDVQRRQA